MRQEEEMILQNELGWKMLSSHLFEMDYSSVFIIVDDNTKIHCLPILSEKISIEQKFEILEISSGEKSKNIQSCIYLWERLSLFSADRNSLIINLGGGMITDLGGFVASTFKRGILFINIPTTLLAMVDASIGGKNGIDFGSAKNQIGTVNLPKMVIIENAFLKTLSKRELTSGFAEMIKHSLIEGKECWEKLKTVQPNSSTEFEELIWESMAVKRDIVQLDPLEKNIRKTLNYGHTLGHAIESHFLGQEDRETLLHGEAIAIGIILASYISRNLYSFPKERLMEISKMILSHFSKQKFSESDIKNIIDLLIFDKKNRNGKVLFVLMRDIGKMEINCTVDNDLIYKAFDFYKNL